MMKPSTVLGTLITVGLLIVLGTGCEGNRHQEANMVDGKTKKARTLAPGKVRLTPCDFFGPSTKRLGMHLNWTTGCIKLQCNCRATCYVQFTIDVWRNGKVQRFDDGAVFDIKGPFEADISYSIQEVIGERGKKVLRLVTAMSGRPSLS